MFHQSVMRWTLSRCQPFTTSRKLRSYSFVEASCQLPASPVATLGAWVPSDETLGFISDTYIGTFKDVHSEHYAYVGRCRRSVLHDVSDLEM